MSVAYIWKLQENTATLCKIGCETLRVSAIRASGYVRPGKLKRPPFPFGVRICPTREVETPSSPIRHQALDVKYPEKAERRKGDRLRVQGVGIPPPNDGAIAIRSTPFRFLKRTRDALPYPDSLREKHTALAIITPWTIAYPIRICCPDHRLK